MNEPQGKYANVWTFKGGEEDMALRWMWCCLTDLSFKGKVEVLWRVLLAKKPDWIYDYPARKR